MNPAIHLTEEQIDDHLIGDLADDQKDHLGSCGYCQARVAEMEAPIASFKSVSLAWSERQSATMPVRPSSASLRAPRSLRALWAAAAVAAIVVAVGVPMTYRGSVKTAPVTSQAGSYPEQTFSAEREEQIAQDNRMLQAIDREIGAPVRSPSETFGLDLGDSAQHSAHTGSVRD